MTPPPVPDRMTSLPQPFQGGDMFGPPSPQKETVMSEPTKQQIEMARRIAKATVKNRNMQRDNALVYGAALEATLAAIMETQRLDAELVERAVSPDWPYAVPALASRRDLATAVRTGEHYALAGDRHGQAG